MHSVPSVENVIRSQRSDEEMQNKETYECDFEEIWEQKA